MFTSVDNHTVFIVPLISCFNFLTHVQANDSCLIIVKASYITVDKLSRTKEALHEWCRKKSATLKELQSLIGTLQFACRVVVPGRAFLQRIISLTKGISSSRWLIKLNTEFRKDVSMWLAFLEHWNGVTFLLGDTVLSSPDLHLYTDASGSLGYGGYPHGQWFQSHWLPQHCLNPVTGISIDWLLC